MSTNYSPADVIRQMMVDLGLGSFPVTQASAGSWPIYVTTEPSSPDNVVTVYNTEAQDTQRMMVDGSLVAHHGFQVRLRATDEKSGYDKAETIRQTFAKSVEQRTVKMQDGTIYEVPCIGTIGPVLSLGKDVPNSKRSLFTLNAAAVVRRTDTGAA